jgi:hypothetical protein
MLARRNALRCRTLASARSKGLTVEKRAEPAVQTALSEVTVSVDMKPIESGNDARPPRTPPEKRKAARRGERA